MSLKDNNNLKNMRAVAKLVDMSVSQFWRWVRDFHEIDPPTTRIGHRDYYDPEQVKKVIDQVETLRKKGAL